MPSCRSLTSCQSFLPWKQRSLRQSIFQHRSADVIDLACISTRRCISTGRKHCDTSSSPSASGYFSQNLDVLSRKRFEDIEDSWRRAQLSEDGTWTPEDLAPKHTSRTAQLAAANAALSFDDVAGSVPSGLGYRDLIMRCTSIDSQGDISKRSESIPKSQLCTNHGLQVSTTSPRDS